MGANTKVLGRDGRERQDLKQGADAIADADAAADIVRQALKPAAF